VTLETLAAVIGSPIEHSLSPAIHRAAFAEAGVDWSYAAFDVAEGQGAQAIAAMRVLGIGGLSVTMPHKHVVAAAVDRLDPAALALESVNTVSWDGDDLVGSSTDGAGFIAALDDEGVDVADSRVVVLGAGGAAKSIIDALGRAGAAEIRVVNRTAANVARAVVLAEAAIEGGKADVSKADIVVNATSVGMGVDLAHASVDDLPCSAELLKDSQVVVDLVYHPLRTAWLDAASAVGAHAIDGLGMLVHQAVLQQECWLGTRPDPKVMRVAAEAELASR